MTTAAYRPSCTVGSGFADGCQQPGEYVAHWTDNDDEGLLCEEHAAVARTLPNGPSLHLRTAKPIRSTLCTDLACGHWLDGAPFRCLPAPSASAP